MHLKGEKKLEIKYKIPEFLKNKLDLLANPGGLSNKISVGFANNWAGSKCVVSQLWAGLKNRTLMA